MKCPHCSSELKPVLYPGGTLNREQWESVKAGDWFCDSGTAFVYFWNRDLDKIARAIGGMLKAEGLVPVRPEIKDALKSLAANAEPSRTETLLLEILGELKKANEKGDPKAFLKSVTKETK